MTSESKTTYASGVEIVVGKKQLNAGEFIHVEILYESAEYARAKDSFVVTLNKEEAIRLASRLVEIAK